MMAISHAEGESDPSKVTLEDLPLMRLLLDRAKDVEEALALIGQYNVRFSSIPIHYLIADASGDSALVEYLDGLPVITRGVGNFQVSTNFIVAEEQPVRAESSCSRYNALTTALADSGGKVDPARGMQLLSQVSQAGREVSTRWSAVYDLTHRTLRVAMGRDYQHVYAFSLK